MKLVIIYGVLLCVTAVATPRRFASECLDAELDMWEAERGALPGPDEADLIIEMCVKQAFEKQKEDKENLQQRKEEK